MAIKPSECMTPEDLAESVEKQATVHGGGPMNRRAFLAMIGLAPWMPKAEPANHWTFVGYTTAGGQIFEGENLTLPDAVDIVSVQARIVISKEELLKRYGPVLPSKKVAG
jgi:hypothetical protein